MQQDIKLRHHSKGAENVAQVIALVHTFPKPALISPWLINQVSGLMPDGPDSEFTVSFPQTPACLLQKTLATD